MYGCKATDIKVVRETSRHSVPLIKNSSENSSDSKYFPYICDRRKKIENLSKTNLMDKMKNLTQLPDDVPVCRLRTDG